MEGEKRFGKYNGAAAQGERPAIKGLYQPPKEGDGQKLNAGFIATVAAVFVAAGTGAFFFLGDGESPPREKTAAVEKEKVFESAVDAKCSKGWRKELPNVDQMHCYLTKNTRRLCDPEERAHLIATIEKFEDDYGVWWRRHFAASMGVIGKANSMNVGMGAAQMTAAMNDPNLTDEERQKVIDKFENTMDDVLGESNKILAEAQNDTPHYQLGYDLRDLASLGLVSEDDFGWSKPDWVKKGFASVKKVKPACAK